MVGPGKRDLGHWQAWAVTVVPRAGPAQFKSEARKAGGMGGVAHSKAQRKPAFLPCLRFCFCF